MGIEPNAPAADQVEITLIGPGFGECVLVHLGKGQWVIVDSCISNAEPTALPAAIQYLESLKICPGDAVRLIVATHWHDDHIRGMAELVRRCPNARFCSSSVLSAKEFIAMVSAYDSGLFSECTSGVREVHEVFRWLSGRVPAPRMASPDQCVFALPPSDSGHGFDCRITSLSPSDRAVQDFFQSLGAMIPAVRHTKKRCVPKSPNYMAIVLWISIGPIAILLGSDLEETAGPETGWSVIVGSRTRPAGAARIFKVPHHGAASAHNQDVWQHMLVAAPHAILTPWNRGGKLPTLKDVNRINEMTKNAYSTSSLVRRKVKKRNLTVERQLKEAGITISHSEPPTGILRLRNGGIAAFDAWAVERDHIACHLSQVHG